MALNLPFRPPLPVMLAKPGPLPEGDGWLYEPKWDGFRALVFKSGDELYIQSRDEKPLGRYFPELEVRLRAALPDRCILDGEIVIVTNGRLDFDAMLLRIHPAASRVAQLAAASPSAYVAWDLLALGDDDLRERPLSERRRLLDEAFAAVPASSGVHASPCSRDIAVARDWFERFEGAGLDGVIAKPDTLVYTPGKRVMVKIKHQRTADCVVAGFRWYKGGKGTLVGSLLLGLYDADGKLHHVGVSSSFKAEERARLVEFLAPLRDNARDGHPWREWADWQDSDAVPAQRLPGATSRWNRGKDLSWEPLRLELVAEVAYDHLQGTRFRHATRWKRWRPDKPASECRYDQLDATAPVELARLFT
nr:ATP-dependent DNA ligase [Kofleriaceae bacterium]